MPDQDQGFVQFILAASHDNDCAPSAAKRMALAKPIPLLPPVTMAIFPLSLFMSVSLKC